MSVYIKFALFTSKRGLAQGDIAYHAPPHLARQSDHLPPYKYLLLRCSVTWQRGIMVQRDVTAVQSLLHLRLSVHGPLLFDSIDLDGFLNNAIASRGRRQTLSL
jgi:hypothetical protein